MGHGFTRILTDNRCSDKVRPALAPIEWTVSDLAQRPRLAHAVGAKAGEICGNPRGSVSRGSLRPRRFRGERLFSVVACGCAGDHRARSHTGFCSTRYLCPPGWFGMKGNSGYFTCFGLMRVSSSTKIFPSLGMSVVGVNRIVLGLISLP